MKNEDKEFPFQKNIFIDFFLIFILIFFYYKFKNLNKKEIAKLFFLFIKK